MKLRGFRRAAVLLLCLTLLLPLLPQGLPAASADEPGETAARESRIIVSLGDSFSSGEGIEPFYGQDAPIASRVQNPDWLAHRSENVWSGMLRLPAVSGQMRDHRNTNWYFVASSGATTEHIKRTGSVVIDHETGRKEGEQNQDYDRDGLKGSKNLPGQLDVFYETPGLDRYDVDYVTITIGGNDVGFSKVLMKAHHTILSTEMYDYIDKQLADFYKKGGIYYKLRDAYRRIAEAAPNATILVAGYPELLDCSGNGPAFNYYESTYINMAVRILNKRIQALIGECRDDGMKIEFVDVVPAFKNHQAYSDDPYLNPIYYYKKDQDLKAFDLFALEIASQYSMHPNISGARVYAECVQAVIDRLEGEKSGARPVRETSDVRNVVLVLDTSGSMEGEPLRETKYAAAEFVETVLREDAGIGLVCYDDNAVMVADFSKNELALKDAVDGLYVGGMTNTEAGLACAAKMLAETEAEKKIIVLMSDGMANVGRVGEDLAAYAEELKADGIYIYTLGFFQYVGWERPEVQASMEAIASPGCHYEVDNAANLRFFFGDVADQINGQKYVYVRIACPVDVQVTYEGETLSSADNCTRTSFGSLTFEESESSGYGYGGDDRTKILRLREGAAYSIEIFGNGEGTMNYTAGFMDENGEYTDMREISDVPITAQTKIRGNADRNDATTLDVDEDGDGIIDRTYREGGPPIPEKTDLSFLLWIGLGLLAVGAAAFFLLRARKRTAGVPAAAYGAAAGREAPARPEPRMETAPKAEPRADPAPKPGTDAFAPAKPGADAFAPAGALDAFANAAAGPKPAPEPPAEPEPAPEPPAEPEPAPKPVKVISGKFCGHCGAPVTEGMPFCGRCGKRL